MKNELQVVAPPQYRAYQLVAAHDSSEDFTVYQPATFTQRWYALAIDLTLFAPLDVLIHLPFKRYLERMDAYGYDGRYGSLVALLWALPLLLYFVAPTLLWGQTLGKRIVGIRVVRRSFNPNVSLGHVLIRETIGKTLSIVLFGVGIFMVLFSERRRALHDVLAKTQVVTYRVR